MTHQLSVETDEFVKTLKDASLYASNEDGINATSYIMLSMNQKQKAVSVIACDGRGYYERAVLLIPEKGQKASLPGKPMSLFIPAGEIKSIAKTAKCHGPMRLEVGEVKNNKYQVNLAFPNSSAHEFSAPANLEIPDYAGIRKLAEKGKKSTLNIGHVMLPINELTRAGKVFPVQIGSTIPMYIAKWKTGGLVTLLEYQSEIERVDIKVIFALGISEAA